jgi:TRAP-type C4-dicarboxylate transport system substrate-binding protein
LKTLDDFKGLNIPVLSNATHLAAFQALGARPAAIALPDVDRALRQGDIDGLELDYTTMFANKYYESQKYFSDTGHFLDFHVLVADRKMFASFDAGAARPLMSWPPAGRDPHSCEARARQNGRNPIALCLVRRQSE